MVNYHNLEPTVNKKTVHTHVATFNRQIAS
jgi:hypothetical protein